jgi:hypothetical protein
VNGSIITSEFNSFSGLSLGGNQSGGSQFFFGGDSVTVTFPKAVNAVGVFFNVNANSGNCDLKTPAGNVSTGGGPTTSPPSYSTGLPLLPHSRASRSRPRILSWAPTTFLRSNSQLRLSPLLFHSSPPALVRWDFLVGAGSGRTRLVLQLPDQTPVGFRRGRRKAAFLFKTENTSAGQQHVHRPDLCASRNVVLSGH